MSGFNHEINIWQWWKKKTLPFIAIIIKIGFYETELILMGIGCISSVFNFSASKWCLLLCLLPQHLQHNITSNHRHLFPDTFLSPVLFCQATHLLTTHHHQGHTIATHFAKALNQKRGRLKPNLWALHMP